ncbi:Type 1 glutamine amidotransferase-like domain-containing protein [Cuneatibacter caecimuris]|uniref:Dipeptidase E n=1 Tax=Cuneatibacter caecimuris TaxID=1796618 RepID=A0A4Q7NXD5_9FIRM|nr:Type 1 glutamine amidotransferase-like domain-containing protein [Cuneatibacter caecimuris]RZS92041.1 dipeptidase E [Cuneatibacter caecimuris]
MGRIVAIAGGDLLSTRQLNAYTIKLSNKRTPNVLFIGTASHDAEGYIESITKEYAFLGCNVKSLCLMTDSYSGHEIDTLLSWADIVYVGGGDTVFMMQTWKKFALDEKLKRIYEQDLAVLTGISAGAVCWFNCGYSDSESFQNGENWNYCWANDMLDIFHMAYCPHYNEEGRDTFDTMLVQKDMIGLAMENNTAFVCHCGNQYFIRSTPAANAFFVQYKDGMIEKQGVTFEDI